MNIDKLINELMEMRNNGTLPSPKELTKTFLGGFHLIKTIYWFNYFQEYCDLAISAGKDKVDIEENPLETVVFHHVQRMRRYIVGINRLAFPNGPGIYYSIDCYYPILKSIFELMVEFRLSISFLHHFDDTRENRKDLLKRITDYSDLAKKQHNYKFHRMRELFNFRDDIKPATLREYENAGLNQAKTEISEVAKRVNKGRFNRIKHWYPYQDKNNRDIGNKNYQGSMQWRCKSVLGQFSPSNDEQYFWKTKYDTVYDVLNRYSHPVLGYDDNLRPESERLLDLYRMLAPFIWMLDMFFIPDVNRVLSVRMENSEIFLTEWKKANKVMNDLIRHYYTFFISLDMQS